MSQNKHIWSFSTVGGVKRVNIETGADLIHLKDLDQKLWTALSCPVEGLEIDRKTLEIIDKDKDGFIRVPEIIDAVNWSVSILKNPNDLLKMESEFPLSSINDETEIGKMLLASAKIVLKNLGKPDATVLKVEETSDIDKIFESSKFNGDGIITIDSTSNDSIKILINEIIDIIGSERDRGGKQGVNKEQVDLFFVNCEKYLTWYAKANANSAEMMPFGESSEEAYLSFLEVKSKIEDYFLRCKLASFDSQTTDALNILVSRVEQISSKDLTSCIEEISSYPLSKIDASKGLNLVSELNPAWELKIARFNEYVIKKTHANLTVLSETDWKTIKNRFTDYISWKSEKEGELVEKLGLEKIREIMDSNLKIEFESLFQKEKLLEVEANSILLVDQLVRYHRDLFVLLKNFVTFYDFYTPGSKAIFQAGTLYIDQRSCNLCIKVQDMQKHASMVSYSGMFLIYCECISKSKNEKMTIVAALTNGDIDNLVVGRNALFYDRNGLDWNATVIKIVDNPISIKQAFWSPYRKVSNFIEKQVNKVAAAQDEKVTSDATKKIEEIPVKSDLAPTPKAPVQPFDVGKFVGIFAAIGLALGAIGTVIASIIAGFMGLVWWKMPFALMGVVLLISGPSMLMAFLKLRKRNLAPILDANGWAINAKAVVNIQFGNLLTSLADLPKGAKINLNDPFTKKKLPYWPFVLGLMVIVAIAIFFLWKYGFIHIRFPNFSN